MRELKIEVYLFKNLNIDEINEEISILLNYSMNKDELLGELHKKTGVKKYVFSNLLPLEEDLVYKANRGYNFTIRSTENEVLNRFKKVLSGIKNKTFFVINVNENKINLEKNIKYIENITPSVLSKKSIYWNNRINDMEEAKELIFKNMDRKFKLSGNLETEIKINDVIEKVELIRNYPNTLKYKGIKILGFKFRIFFKKNVIAQEYAKISLMQGTGEKNSSLGCGFSKGVWEH